MGGVPQGRTALVRMTGRARAERMRSDMLVVLGIVGLICLPLLLLWMSVRLAERAAARTVAELTSNEKSNEADAPVRGADPLLVGRIPAQVAADTAPDTDDIPVPPADLAAYATVGIAALEDWLESQPPRR